MADQFSTEQLLHMAISEHFAPGELVTLDLEAPGTPNAGEPQKLEDILRSQGLADVKVRFGSTESWPNALRITFSRPKHLIAPSQFQLIAILIAGLGAIGFGGIAGWKIGTSISNNILPIALIGASAAVLIVLALSKGNAKYDIAVRR